MSEECLATICQQIESALPAHTLQAIYLFGSHAKGHARPDSDLDIAILAAHELDIVALFELSLKLTDIANVHVDLIDLRAANTVFRKEITAYGRTLRVYDSSRQQEFEMYALSNYARLNEERAPVLRALGHLS